MLPTRHGSDGSYNPQGSAGGGGSMHPVGFQRAGTPTSAVEQARPARRSRAGAGGRLKDLLQQEAKDLRVRGVPGLTEAIATGACTPTRPPAHNCMEC